MHGPYRAGSDERHEDMALIDESTKQLITTLPECAATREACARDRSKQGSADLADCIALCMRRGPPGRDRGLPPDGS